MLVLLPGWATDYRIFNTLDLNYNYLACTRLNPFTLEQDLLNNAPGKKMTILGYSLGGFLAADFAVKYPQFIQGLILLGIRRSYQPQLLKYVRQHLLENRRAYLYSFYLDCFSALDRAGLAWFRKHLLKRYLNEMKLKELSLGLDYLASSKIEPARLKVLKDIRIFHGKEDKIAPIAEACSLKEELPQAKFFKLEGVGHISFLGPVFKDRFYND